MEAAAANADVFLTHDLVVFALPAAYFRYVLAPGAERLVETLVAAASVGILAYHLFRDGSGSWLHAAVVLTIQFSTLAFFTRSLRWKMAGILLASSAGLLVAIDRQVVPLTLPILDLAFGTDGAWIAAVATLFGAAGVAITPPLLAPARRKLSLPITVALVAVAVAAPPAHLRAAGSALASAAAMLLPIDEFAQAYSTLLRFMPAEQLASQLSSLAMVTIHCQYSLGRLGVTYLRSAQLRKNQLLNVGLPPGDAKRVPSLAFARSVLGFVLLSGLPYMAQRTCIESINTRQQQSFLFLVDMELRLNAVLADGASLHTAAGANHTVESYSEALSTVVSTPYNLLERKIFSLPKLALLPAVFASHPVLGLVALPVFVGVDGGKSWLNAKLTEQIEVHRRAAKRLESTIAKVNAFDLKHAGQIASANAFTLTRQRWSELLLSRQAEQTKMSILRSLRNWLGWLYWQDVLQPGIEVAIAALLEAGHIGLADVWLYARVIEDAVDMLLMRSRAEAQLAMLVSDSRRLVALDKSIKEAQGAPKVSCHLDEGAGEDTGTVTSLLRVNCDYSRGTARVQVSNLSLPPAIYALAGPNGSGKSTLLSVLTACRRGGGLLPGISVHGEEGCTVELMAHDDRTGKAGETRSPHMMSGEIRSSSTKIGEIRSSPTMDNETRSSHMIVEVHQRPYCPLHCAPIRWLAAGVELAGDGVEEAAAAAAAAGEPKGGLVSGVEGRGESEGDTKDDGDDARVRTLAAKAASLAVDLRFVGATRANDDAAAGGALGAAIDGAATDSAATDGAVAGAGSEPRDAEAAGLADGGTIAALAATFMSEAEDYCGGLSGGQRAKLEVIRSVFLQRSCPRLLLLDEPFAALDATSKALLIHKLRSFCAGSVLIVVYHPENDGETPCEAQRGFFDAVLEVKSGALMPPTRCAS